MSDQLFLDLRRLYTQQQVGDTWGVGAQAERALLLARDASGGYLWSVEHTHTPPRYLFGMSVLLDLALPEGRIELRDQDGRVVGAIEGVV